MVEVNHGKNERKIRTIEVKGLVRWRLKKMLFGGQWTMRINETPHTNI